MRSNCSSTTISNVLTQRIRYKSRAARKMVLDTHMEHTVALGFDLLETLLASLERRKRKEK